MYWLGNYWIALFQGTKIYCIILLDSKFKGQVGQKSTFFKELTPHSRTYELRGQGEKKNSIQNQDKQTPHTVLQKLPPKTIPTPSIGGVDSKLTQ